MTSGPAEILNTYRGTAWSFARLLKSQPELARLQATQVAQWVDSRFRALFPDSEDPWIEAGFSEIDVYERDCHPYDHLLDIWDTIQWPLYLEGDVVGCAAVLAAKQPLMSQENNKRDLNYLRVVSLCYWLSRIAGNPFFLACRKVEEVLDIDRESSNRHLRRAVREGFLEQTGKREHARSAQTYIFNLDRVINEPE